VIDRGADVDRVFDVEPIRPRSARKSSKVSYATAHVRDASRPGLALCGDRGRVALLREEGEEVDDAGDEGVFILPPSARSFIRPCTTCVDQLRRLIKVHVGHPRKRGMAICGRDLSGGVLLGADSPAWPDQILLDLPSSRDPSMTASSARMSSAYVSVSSARILASSGSSVPVCEVCRANLTKQEEAVLERSRATRPSPDAQRSVKTSLRGASAQTSILDDDNDDGM